MDQEIKGWSMSKYSFSESGKHYHELKMEVNPSSTFQFVLGLICYSFIWRTLIRTVN